VDFSRVELDEDQQRFLEEVRAFTAEHVTEEVHEHERQTGSGFNLGVHLELGKRGWVMPEWPVEKGGAGLDPVRAKLLDLELHRARLPDVTMGTTRLTIGTVEKFGDPIMVAEVVKQVAEGTARICLGYSETESGSDIAGAKTRAVQDGDEWVINGQKIWTTGAQQCQYAFLITRTDFDLPKHKGLTMFLLPLEVPGVEIQPIHTYGGERTNVVYFSDVRISDRYRLGGVNDGWSVLRGPLDDEHSIGGPEAERSFQDISIGSMFVHQLERALDAAYAWAKTPAPDGSRPIDDPLVQYRLGAVALRLEASISTPGPLGRVKGSESLVLGGAELVDLVGPLALISEGHPDAHAGGEIDYSHRFAQGTATYGGTVEVFRNIIAQHVLGLPRANYPGHKVLSQKRRESSAAVASPVPQPA
jgi:alkylation response protein AidB-like acyl-CoA dehydrogenase